MARAPSLAFRAVAILAALFHEAAGYTLTNPAKDTASRVSAHLGNGGNSSNTLLGCFKSSYGRGVGVPLQVCPAGYEEDAGLCYPKCAAGERGVGPVCWPYCPAGYRDDGAFCYKPAASGRGFGHWSQSACEAAEHQPCERCIAFYYPVCPRLSTPAGCNLCSPYCPERMTDIGISCAKYSEPRGAGVPKICDAGFEQAGELCYPVCAEDYKGVGPVCFFTQCKDSYPEDCGLICAAQDQCSGIKSKLGIGSVGEAAAVATAVAGCVAIGAITWNAATVACIAGAVGAITGTGDLISYLTDNFKLCSAV